MYKTYQLSETDKKKHYIMHWDGDTYYYDVYESENEKREMEERCKKIEEEYEKCRVAYVKFLEEQEKGWK